MYQLVQKYITCTVESDFQIYQKQQGIIQGSAISPALSNLYLHEFDTWMEDQGYSFVRFADNINVYISDLEEAKKVLNEIENKLKTYGLTLNENKKGIYTAISRVCLGYVFEKKNNRVIVKKYRKKKKKVYYSTIELVI